MADHSPDPARLLGSAVRRFFEHGEYHGPEETFDERYLAFMRKAAPLGGQGQMILEFMHASLDAYEPLLRAINDIGLLLRYARENPRAEWRPVAARVRGHLQIAERRYTDPAAVHFSVQNLTGIFNEVVALLEAGAI
ncbi:MAG TPA: hypothetical protein PKV72_06500 [Candidatus Peribacteria bacterium]|nr:hypothetical protein [Candidatus Peribacteria bacterium]